MKIAIMGIGGIGGIVGGALARKFDDIHFIARGKTLEAIRKNGLSITSTELGEFITKPASITDNPDEIGVVDVLVLATKSYDLKSACELCAPIIDENTIIIPLLNGVSIAEETQTYCGGKGQVAHGCIYCFAHIVSPGVIEQSGALFYIDVGFKDQRKSPTLEKFVAMLNEVGIKTNYRNDILTSVWEKYMMMGGNSCAFAYYENNAGEIRADQEKVDYIRGIYQELANIAKAVDVTLADDIVDKYMNVFNNVPDGTITSLYRDMKVPGKKNEFDAIIGEAYRIGTQAGVPIPLIEKVYKKYRP